MAHVAVIGSGVVGVASAYLLCKAGHQVTLVDRNAGPALSTSRRNGAQLSYGYCDALASPSLLSSLPAILFGRDPAYRVRLQADPEFLIWGLRLLANGAGWKFRANTKELLELAARSASVLKDLLAEFDLAFDYQVSGKMVLYASDSSVKKGAAVRQIKQALGLRQEVMTLAQARDLEPALSYYQGDVARVLFNPVDAVGRPDQFCATLIDRLISRYGLQTAFGEEVKSLTLRNNRVAALAFGARAPIACGAAVVATALAPAFLLRRDKGFGRVWPVRGYSITGAASQAAVRVSITDLSRKLVFARIGQELRIAGLADIGSREPVFQESRLNALRSLAQTAFAVPMMEGPDEPAAAWAGDRPCAPSSQPIVGRSKIAGLYLNLAHGALGWTLCLGSAQKLMTTIAEDFGR